MNKNDEHQVDNEEIDIIDSLLSKFSDSRDSMELYLNELSKLKDTISKIFPESIDYRNKHLIEDKLKTTSTFYSSMLDVRKEINKTIKDEIELRNKLKRGNDDEIKVNIRDLAKQLQSHMKGKK